ncbi:hypothetical protein PK35_05110 [Tamlana nanhaiensis]|uniref:O-antigen ligase-related domain-containing protein n=2 Tax=Neotamlana nanhaiensis TaxID=1382798 RepID=A0A0D7W4P2_9FLAO|nr:hypothetical protein PK35_05110 [Tamlana nanhaiensis]
MLNKTQIKLQHINSLLYLVAMLPLFSLKMVSISIIIFLVTALFNFFHRKEKLESINYKYILLFAAPFFLNILALLYTNNYQISLKILEKNLAIIIFPVVFFFLKPFYRNSQFIRFIQVYILSCFAMVVFSIIYVLVNVSNIVVNNTNNNNYQSVVKLRESLDLVPIIGEHTIYYSLLVGVGLLLLYYNRFKSIILNILLYVFFVLGLLLASSKGVILALILVSICVIFQKNKNVKRSSLVTVVFLVGISLLGYFSPLKVRIESFFKNKHFYPTGIHYNSVNIRNAIYSCSFSLIDDAGLFGFSPGDTQVKLNECYKQFDTVAFQKKSYNTHNQYLDYLLSFGFVGLFIMLFVYFQYLKIALKANNRFYLNFLIFFYIAFLTENILARNTGIILFNLFNCLMGYRVLILKETYE